MSIENSEIKISNSLKGIERKQLRTILNAINDKYPRKALVGVLGDWGHCGDRDCPEQSGMYHIEDALSGTNNPEILSTVMARHIAEFLPELPESLVELTGSDKYRITRATANILAIAASLREPKVLAEPLAELVKSQRILQLKESSWIDGFTLSQISEIETNPAILLREAVILNQSDNRYEDLWLKMLAEGNSQLFPIFANESSEEIKKYVREIAMNGILHIPEVLNPQLDPVLIEAGRIISEIEEYKNPANPIDDFPMSRGVAKRDKDFRQLFVWPILFESQADETIIKEMLNMKDRLGWQRWAQDSLEYFLTPSTLGLSPLQKIYYKAALHYSISKIVDNLGRKEHIYSSAQVSSSEHTTLSLISHSLFYEIDEEVRSIWGQLELEELAYKKLTKEGVLPKKLSLKLR